MKEKLAPSDPYFIEDRELRHLINQRNYKTFSVAPANNGKWIIRKNGVGMAGESFDRKAEAKKKARKTAKINAPSVLVFMYGNGSVEDWVEYKSWKDYK